MNRSVIKNSCYRSVHVGAWDGIDELETATIEYALMGTNKNHAFELKVLERNTTFDMFQYGKIFFKLEL